MYGTFDIAENKQRNAEAERILQSHAELDEVRAANKAAAARLADMDGAALPAQKTHQSPDAYQGHASDGSSGQKHSLGPDYPYILVGTATGWYYQGPDGKPFSEEAPTVTEARIKLYARRGLRLMHS